MPSASPNSDRTDSGFKAAFEQLLCRTVLREIIKEEGPQRRRPPKLSAGELIIGLVFHYLQDAGTLAGNIRMLFRKKLADSTLSERRQTMPWEVFSSIMKVALRPKAVEAQHPEAFYQGWRLVAIDGTQFSVSNTPQLLASLTKAASRRMKAAFAKVGVVLLVELGIHNPIAAVIAREEESELALAKALIDSLPEGILLIADRLYGVGAFVRLLVERFASVPGHFLVRVRANLKAKPVEHYGDGSALMEVKLAGHHGKLLIREVQGRVRRPGGQWVQVRFWTSLLDWKQYPASELLALYVRRWEQELMYKQLKVDMRQAELVKSHTLETAAQEIAALVLAHAILAQERLQVSALAKKEPLRISFGKTLRLVRSLWLVIAAADKVLSGEQKDAIVNEVLRIIAAMALPLRRKRSCPRAVRQPVGSWPRLTKNTYSTGASEYKLTPIRA
jgi:hypothetical protein